MKRYDFEPCMGYEPKCHAEMAISPNGDYVLHSDAEAAIAAAVAAERERCAKVCEEMVKTLYCDEWTTEGAIRVVADAIRKGTDSHEATP